jgi:hypothetical protein
MQMESAFNGTAPSTTATQDAKKIYFSSEGLALNQDLVDSLLIRGNRHASAPMRGKLDIAGNITTELMAQTPLYYAAFGSMDTVQTGGSMGTALTTPVFTTVDAINQTILITATAHGLVCGDSVEITTITSPVSMNGKVYPVVSVPTANTFVIRIPMGLAAQTFTFTGGAIKKVTTPGTIFTHTLKAGGALPSYLIEKGFLDISQYFLYKGCKLDKFGFTLGADGLITVTTDWMGASEAVAVTSYEIPANVLDLGKSGFDGLSAGAPGFIKENNVAIATVTEISSFLLENQLDGDTFIVGGGGVRSAVNPGIYKVSGTLKALFMDMALYTKAKNLTPSSLDFKLSRSATGDGTVGNETIQFFTPELVFKPKSPAITGPKGVFVELGFVGYYNTNSDVTGLKMTLMNATPPGQMV